VGLAFDKIEASGNDFVLLSSVVSPDRIAGLCNRHHGIGADGVMVFRGAEEHRVLLDHFDRDGSRSFCLNGVRAALPVLAERGEIPETATVCSEGMTIPYTLEGEARLILPMRPVRPIVWRNRVPGWSVDAGNPQFVMNESLEADAFRVLAREIRADLESFTEGTNVCQICREDELWHILTFERGVEDLTLACGSGIYACALVLISRGETEPLRFRPQGGGLVTITTHGDHLSFEGTTRHVARGDYLC